MKSPARTTGLYGPSGLLMGRTLPTSASAAGGRRARQAAAATAANTASLPLTGAPVVGLDLDADRRRVDGAQDAERADRQVDRHAVGADGQPLAADPARAPCGRRRCSSCAGRPRRAASPQRTPHVHTAVVDGGRSPSLRPALRDRVGRRSASGRRAARRPRPTRRHGASPTSADRATSTSSTARPGPPPAATARRRCRPCGRRGSTPVPSARRPGGDRRALRPACARRPRATYRTRTGRPCSSARRRATAPTSDRHLAPERAAVGQRRRPARRPARTTRRRARGSPARPTSSAACGPSRPAAASIGHEQRRGRTPTLHRAGQPPRLASTSRRRPTRPSGPTHGDEGPGGRQCRRRTRRRPRATCGPDDLRRRRPRAGPAASAPRFCPSMTGPIGP